MRDVPLDASQRLGIVLLVVDAIDAEAEAFYARFGFDPPIGEPSARSCLAARVKDLAATFAPQDGWSRSAREN